WVFDVDPQPSMRVFLSREVASKENKFSGRNTTRWRNEEFDRLYKGAETEMDPVKRAAMFIRMNDLIVQNVVVVPLVWRSLPSAMSNKLKGTDISGWDSNFGTLARWYRESWGRAPWTSVSSEAGSTGSRTAPCPAVNSRG